MPQYGAIHRATGASLILRQKRQIYDRYGEEGLKAHEGGQTQQNPFDIFSNFFGGGCRFLVLTLRMSCPYASSPSRANSQGTFVRHRT